MKKLAWLAMLLLVVGAAGCDSGDIDETVPFDDEANLNLEDPVVDDNEPAQPEELPAQHQDYPVIYQADPGAIYWTEPDGIDFVNTQITPVEDVTPEALTPAEMMKIDILRQAIEQGLALGKDKYLETVSLTLANLNIAPDYEEAVENGFADLEQQPEACPFAKYYDNGFEPSGLACDYLVDKAKVEVYSELSKALDSVPLPQEVVESEHAAEAGFWYEQGAISGVEEERVLVRTDLKQKSICNKVPTPVQSSYDKGVVVGRQLLAKTINQWLASKGHVGDYPKMSNPIQVCNADQTMLLPSKQAAMQAVPQEAEVNPLCEDYVPPSEEGILQYSQAKLDYQKGIKEGVASEFAMAAVLVFKVIPCNVGDPIVVDLDRDGIELLSATQGVNFDFYAVGSKQAVAWVAPDDGLLVLDRNGNGAIDDGSELFGNVQQEFEDGFAHLATLDENRDGVVDAADAGFARLQVWKDANTDGVSSASELVSLTSLGVSSLSLAAQDVYRFSAEQRIGKLSMASGLLIGDAYFTTAPYARVASR